MPREVPLSDKNNPLLEQVVSLDGREFAITYDWSERANNWSFRINASDGATLSAGGNLVPFTDLLRHIASEERPGGALILITKGTDETPTLEALQEAELLYYTVEELGRG